jgi:hypothetical protein
MNSPVCILGAGFSLAALGGFLLSVGSSTGCVKISLDLPLSFLGALGSGKVVLNLGWIGVYNPDILSSVVIGVDVPDGILSFSDTFHAVLGSRCSSVDRYHLFVSVFIYAPLLVSLAEGIYPSG